ncbi:Rrf2 family transcriptional regulator [Desulfobacula sp.]|uniref:RrF2 family transcriptional regulator n=1 Tax=Desulfobacula sp. TaxID=2593537 RepID=UPI002622A062|nr:Rrf2 family transcriptional regulator [Desulfobacula sp.]
MKLATQVRYGTRILLDLAKHQNNGIVPMGDISSRQNISLKYLEQLIIPIKNAGFVASKRGPKGGYRLAKSPDQITLAQIIRVFEKEHAPQEISGDTSSYSEHQDSLIREAWDEAIEAFYNRLEKVTLIDLSIGTTQKLWKSSDLLIFT